MDKPVVQFKFIGGAGFIRIGHRARIMVLDHPKSSKGCGWEDGTTSEVLEINRERGTFETRNIVYKLWDEQSFPAFTGELTPFQFKWNNPLEGKLPPYDQPVLLVVKGEQQVGVLLQETGSWEDGYADAGIYWDSPLSDGQVWEWEDVTAWAELPPLPQWV